MSGWWQNGRPLAGLAPDDRGLAYGDGLFETVAIRAGKPRLIDWHLERLEWGASRLGFEAPSPDLVADELAHALNAKSSPQTALAKIIVTRGGGRRGYRPSSAESRRLIRVWSVDAPPVHPVELRVGSPRLPRDGTLAGLKHLNRLHEVLSADAPTAASRDVEYLRLDPLGHCVCGTISNVFFVLDDRLVTPALTHGGVAGVMRRLVLSLAPGGVAVEHVPWSRAVTATAAFVTNSQFGLRRVSRLEGRELAPDSGSLVDRVRQALGDAGIEECARS